MNHLFNLLVIGILLVNLLGFSLTVARYTGLTLGLAMAVFHHRRVPRFFLRRAFHRAGELGWLLPIFTVGALWSIWRERTALLADLGAEIAFLAAFSYALLWRYTFPDIDPSSEKLADLNFIASYLQGTRLPAPDLWLHPYTLTQYYSFQHYGAALLGRIMSLPSGTAYNVAYCVIVGLVLAPAYDFVRTFTKNRWSQILILAALLVGGTRPPALSRHSS